MTRRPHPAEARPGLPALLTCAEVAGQLQLSQRHVRRLIAARALPIHRFGAAVRISHDDLARYIAGARHS
jgi:excisionase family DNA binding protein